MHAATAATPCGGWPCCIILWPFTLCFGVALSNMVDDEEIECFHYDKKRDLPFNINKSNDVRTDKDRCHDRDLL